MLKWKLVLLGTVWCIPNSWLAHPALFVIAALLVLVFGIPHGATDHVIHNVLRRQSVQAKLPLRFLVKYLGIMAGYFLLWLWLPRVSLLFFLVLSAYHFGETQLVNIRSRLLLDRYTYLSWGSWLLGFMLLPHINEVAQLIIPLVGPQDTLWAFLSTHYISILVLLTVNLALAWGVQAYFRQETRFIWRQGIELLLLAPLLWRTPVLIGFAFFFALWHSYDAMQEQMVRFRRIQSHFSWTRWAQFALPYTLMSLVGILSLIGLSLYFKVEIPPVTVFFVGVSLLTMPHILLIERFYKEV